MWFMRSFASTEDIQCNIINVMYDNMWIFDRKTIEISCSFYLSVFYL